MKEIYILRHFKVQDSTYSKLTSLEFNDWVYQYDKMKLEYEDIILPKINKTYVSSQQRAINTAKYLQLEYELSDSIQEVESFSFMNTNVKINKNIWLLIDRLLWFFNLRKKENKQETTIRAKRFIEKLENDKNNNILIITHGFFMKVLIKELKRRNYIGEVDFSPKNGKVYPFKKLKKGN